MSGLKCRLEANQVRHSQPVKNGSPDSDTEIPADTCRGIARKVALGFLYTYACLISSESDFHIANKTRLLPRNEDGTPII